MRVFLLMGLDAAALIAAATLGATFPSGGQALPFADRGPWLLALPLFWASYAAAGLYPGFGLGAVETLRRASLHSSLVFCGLAVAGVSLTYRCFPTWSTLAASWAASLVSLPLLRYGVLSWVSRRGWWQQPVVFVGTDDGVLHTLRALQQAISIGYRPVGILAEAPQHCEPELEGVPVLGDLQLATRLHEAGLETVFVGKDAGESCWPADGKRSGGRRISLFSLLQKSIRHVVVIRDGESLSGDVPLVHDLGGVLGFELNNQIHLPSNRLTKRAMDLVLGGVALLISLPVLGLAALAVRLSSPGPALYSQVREGLHGRRFRVWKLRTMHHDADERLEEFLTVDPAARREWEERCKLEKDPRVTAVGRWMRRFSIDELPQLWQVVRGDMSIVGPRPFPGYHLEKFDSSFRDLRCQVRPGITGLWQVMIRSSGTIADQQRFDTHYIRNWSIWLDVYVLAKTIIVVVLGRGAW